eukprot:scaffold63945_cov22-Tisochrysis_lutea.AAC.1
MTECGMPAHTPQASRQSVDPQGTTTREDFHVQRAGQLPICVAMATQTDGRPRACAHAASQTHARDRLLVGGGAAAAAAMQ